MITWQPAPASTWQLCEGQRIIGSVTLGIDGLWRWRRGLAQGVAETRRGDLAGRAPQFCPRCPLSKARSHLAAHTRVRTAPPRQQVCEGCADFCAI